jgi:DNA-binding transcriptional LysR family regulator
VLAGILPGFLARYPKIRLQVLATNRAIDLVDDNVDIAIRARVRLADEATTMRILFKSGLVFVASSAFATAHQIQSAAGADMISALPFLSFLEDVRQPTWTLIGPNGATKTVSFDPVLSSSDFNLLLKTAAAGLGIALLPTDVVAEDLRLKRLIRILPDWQSEEITIHLVFAAKRGIVPAVRVLIDYLVEHFKLRSDYGPVAKEDVETTRSRSPKGKSTKAT